MFLHKSVNMRHPVTFIAVISVVVKLSAARFFDRITVNSAVIDRMSWNCANNATCLHSLSNSVLDSYKRGEVINFGLFNVEKLPEPKIPSAVGRSSGLMSFLSGNAIRVPIGPMVFSIQRAEDDDEYIEIALLRKTSGQGRGGGIGGGGAIGSRIGKQRKEKKQLQVFVPMYLAATTIGWTMLAFKAVGLLTLKALVLSKLAVIVASMVLIKKLMDNASEKLLLPRYPEPQPFIMPYNMDYGMHAIQAPEIGGGDIYPIHIAAAATAGGHGGHPHIGAENVAAESSLRPVMEIQNGTQILAGLTKQMAHHQKIKRDDNWLGATRPFLYNYLPSRPMYNVRQ